MRLRLQQAAATRATIPAPLDTRSLEAARESCVKHPFLVELRRGRFSEGSARRLAAVQLGYNLAFVAALAKMRAHFAGHPRYLTEFLDPHLATEFGASLPGVGLVQSGRSHIDMIYALAASLGMEPAALLDWGPSAQQFFDDALSELLGGADVAHALGALFADEILASAWFPVYRDGFVRYRERGGRPLALEFFISHADEVEPAHMAHALALPSFCRELGLSPQRFDEGYDRFVALFDAKLTGMQRELQALERGETSAGGTWR
jgi:pyrroloquinoline quinone (PQQ) biosynthesis protein C